MEWPQFLIDFAEIADTPRQLTRPPRQTLIAAHDGAFWNNSRPRRRMRRNGVGDRGSFAATRIGTYGRHFSHMIYREFPRFRRNYGAPIDYVWGPVPDPNSG